MNSFTFDGGWSAADTDTLMQFIFNNRRNMCHIVNRKGKLISLLGVISCTLLYLLSNHLHFQTSPCACGSCILEKNEDSWFSERFNASCHPLMSTNSSILSKKTDKWWKSLQPSRTQANYSEVVEKLFQLIPDREHYQDGSPDRCRVCSVVGNSGNLKNSHYGPLIDASDFVFRMNGGPIKGFEEDVGSKTTHRIMYPESAVDIDSTTHLVLFAFKTLDLEWLISVFTTHKIRQTYMPVKSTIKANVRLVMVVNPTFMQYTHKVWLKKHGMYPSTGFMTVVLALHICDQVRVFGFGADKHGNWDHYFEKTPLYFKTGGHEGSLEYDTIRELNNRHKIEMYRGW
ncbi:CMP-N-acetylneuraminate-beta-galactosamide-alpha-2,3-sialyltransferase 1-like isoform X2 [Sardina pilchardus]|uniref:CMP-N-acetylneuraminate-beta-galactosamide- alpha-2,3-sialyltransferase 1-like isoform X2 n=1 Tax=Sardina pilchardus TaxID=27697 RepID=UPI002E154282